MEDTNFVVYGFLRKDYGSFYYIGKGRPYRPYQKGKRTIPHPGCSSRVVILYKNISEELALENEKKLIKLIGRRGVDPHGTLRNIASGGGGVSKKHSKEIKMRLDVSKNKKLNMIKRNWFHSVIGEVYGLTSNELAKKYPEQNLKVHELNYVCKCKRSFYRGWRLLENIITPPFIPPVAKHDWYHPEHGGLYNKTYKEIIELDQSTNIRGLRDVANGSQFSHKGWKLLRSEPVKKFRGVKVDWYHPDFGIIKGKTSREMAEIYSLTANGFYKIRSGQKKSYGGWKFVESLDTNHPQQ